MEDSEVRMQDDSTYSSDKSAAASESETLTNASDGSSGDDDTGWLAGAIAEQARERREQANQKTWNDGILAQQDAAGIDSRGAARMQVDALQSDNEKQGEDAGDESTAANESGTAQDTVDESSSRSEAEIQEEHKRRQSDPGELGRRLKQDQNEKEMQDLKEQQAREEKA